MQGKSKYWVGVLYNENMVENWVNEIGDILQLPYCYCIHDKDVCSDSSERKVHTHIIIVFNNTTTYNHAFSVFSKLNKNGYIAVNKIEQIINIRSMYDYLIHNTETCKRKNKYLYDLSERISGNNFDIGNFEQLSTTDRNNIVKELCDYIVNENICNFADFYILCINEFKDSSYFEILRTYSGLFERLTRANYQKSKEC